MEPILEAVKVEKLFGYLDYTIPNISHSNLIFIIGDNGIGKTTILKLIQALSNRNLQYFNSLIFEKIEFKFIVDEVDINLAVRRNGKTLQWSLVNCGEADDWHEVIMMPLEYRNLKTNKQKADWLYENTDTIELAHCGRHWKDAEVNHMREKDLIEKYDTSFSIKSDDAVSSEKAEFLRNFKTRFVSINRLDKKNNNPYNYPNNEEIDPIDEINSKIAFNISSLYEQAYHSKIELDNNFINSIINSDQLQSNESEDINKKIEEINNTESRFQKYSSRPLTKISQSQSSNNKNILSKLLDNRLAQINETRSKLAEIELFEEILNETIAFKKINLRLNEGLVITNANDVPVHVSDLSSGEKHLISVFYHVIFETSQDTLVLVDEPEISMHVSWQREFSGFLKRISKLKKIRFLCATHSPSILNDEIEITRAIQVSIS